MKNTLIFIVLAGSIVCGQSGAEIIKKLQNRFNSISGFSANFSQTIFTSKDQSSNKTSGKFFYKRKNKFVVEMKNQTIISDGKTVWNYDARFKRVVISSAEDDPTSFSLERFIFEYPKNCTSKEIKEVPAVPGEKEVELVPRTQDLEFKSVRLWTGKDWMISRMEVIDPGGVRYFVELSDLSYNQKLPDSKFIYSPPQGIKIIDLR